MSAKLISTIEKNIKTKMSQIKNGEITKAESKIGLQFKRLRELDEASYLKHLEEYKELINTLE